jgi:phenylacetate-CoA ligase
MSASQSAGFEARKNSALRFLGEYQEGAKLDGEALDELVSSKVKDVIRYCYNNIAWWKDRLGKDFPSKLETFTAPELLQQIPVLTRAEFQTNSKWLKNWVKGSAPGAYAEAQTSGSTGQPVRILKYLLEYNARHHAVILLDTIWQGREFTKKHLSLSQGRKNSSEPTYGEPFEYLARSGESQSLNVSELSLGKILEQIHESGAYSLTANGQLLRMLVNEQLSNPVHEISLSHVISFADPVDQELRAKTLEAFGAKILNRYSTEEFGYLAIQCSEHEHLHALQFHNFIEIVDDEGNPCGVGEIGRVLVTSLTNPGMPLIRYELGDYASWQEPCPSGLGLPVINTEITRIRDGLVDSDGVSFVPTTGKAKFLLFPHLKDFQLYLFEDAIVGLFAVRNPLTALDQEQIQLDLATMFHSNLPVKVLTTDALDWLGSWKRRLFFKVAGSAPSELSVQALKNLDLSIPAARAN